jgi:hypothetical protein
MVSFRGSVLFIFRSVSHPVEIKVARNPENIIIPFIIVISFLIDVITDLKVA